MTKTKVLFTLIGLFVFNLAFGQNQEKYTEFKQEAEKFYDSKEFQKSANKYKEAFDQLDGKAYLNDRYNAACSYALAEDVENSFYHLFRLTEYSIVDYKDITSNSDLNILHKDERWKKLLEIVKANKEEAEKDLDKPLVAILDTIYQDDQEYRLQMNDIKKKYGWKSDEMATVTKIIIEKDSINLIKIEKILDERGWLGSNIIGAEGNTTLFLVIQHADIETQLKYLPMMREAVKIGNANAGSLALLEDRVALRQGKRQIYGSQIQINENGDKFVQPLIDPKHVDKRRAEVGLGTLAEYTKHFGFTWDIQKHKERTAKIEAEKSRK